MPTPPPDPTPRDAQVDSLLLNIVANAGDAILALDPEGHILYWNNGARQMFDYEDHEVLGRHFSLLVPDEVLADGEIATLDRLTQQRGSLHNYETQRRTKTGETLEVSVTRTLLHDLDGNLIGSSAIVRDISKRKKLEHELVEANTLATIGRLSARIAHEIKNPLAGISGATQVLRDSLEETDPRRQIISDVIKEIRRLDNTVNDLLHFARPRKPQLQRVDLVSQVERVLWILREEATMRDLSIEKRYAREDAVVSADPTLIEDTFFNLILNAAQALEGRRDGKLVITVAPRPGGAMVTFTDNGEGIPEEIQGQIFEPFFTTKVRGTGLGLAITRKNIDALGGQLRLETKPRKGTSFTIFFPTKPSEPEPELRPVVRRTP